jgi:hypothetical protein
MSPSSHDQKIVTPSSVSIVTSFAVARRTLRRAVAALREASPVPQHHEEPRLSRMLVPSAVPVAALPSTLSSLAKAVKELRTR